MSKRSATTDHFRQMEREAITAYREWPIFLVWRERHLSGQLAAANAAKTKVVPPQPTLPAPVAPPPEPAIPNFIQGIGEADFLKAFPDPTSGRPT